MSPSFPPQAKRDGKGTRRKTSVGWSQEGKRGARVVGGGRSEAIKLHIVPGGLVAEEEEQGEWEYCRAVAN